MLLMGIGGSTLGMGEEFIPLVPIFLIVAREIRCDRIYGTALVYVAGAVGFAAATTNPFTVNIAQSIAGLPLNSAIGFRLLFFVCCMTVTIVYMLRYGAKIRRDPASSYVAGIEAEVDENVAPPALTKIAHRHRHRLHLDLRLHPLGGPGPGVVAARDGRRFHPHGSRRHRHRPDAPRRRQPAPRSRAWRR